MKVYTIGLACLLVLIASHATPALCDDAAVLPPEVLNAMLPEDRQHYSVINGSDVAVATDPAQMGVRHVAADGKAYTVNGETYAVPNVTPPYDDDGFGASMTIRGSAISIDIKSGPFHGVYSNPGYAFEEATVHLPSEHKPVDTVTTHTPSSDTVYVYMGGESKAGGAVDAGFQHSGINDDWVLFLTCEGFGFHYDEINRFVSNQDVKLRFYIPANNYIVVSATGRSFEGDTVTRTIVLDINKFPDTSPPAPEGRAGKATGFAWRADGDGVILKRMTSIAQVKQSFATKSFAQHVAWTNVTIGETATTARPWTKHFTGGQMNWPDTKHVIVKEGEPKNDEVVSIFLNK